MIWGISEIGALLAGWLLLVAALEAGFRTAFHRQAHWDDATKSHIGALQGAVLGLLALLLGFTFAMAVSRFDNRKALVLEEANAIGTTYLRARFLPSPQNHEVAALLRDYVEARLDFYEAGIELSRLDAANVKASRIEDQLWALTVAAAAADPRSVPIGLLIESVNEVIDVREKRRVALDNHVPEVVLYLLYVTAAVALGLVGYNSGLAGKRRLASGAIVAALIALVLTTILDIDRPRRGLILVSQDSLIRLRATLAQSAQ